MKKGYNDTESIQEGYRINTGISVVKDQEFEETLGVQIAFIFPKRRLKYKNRNRLNRSQ
jgi:hypothetical protein